MDDRNNPRPTNNRDSAEGGGGPLVSVVTPTFNVRDCLEATLRSVACQTCPHKEYIVIDGGSTDGTVELLKQYEGVIDRWISEPDLGVYDAMNKGINLAKGEWLYFLGAGDELAEERVLERVFSKTYRSKFLYGDVLWGEDGKRYDGRFSKLKLCRQNICHQAIFYHRDLFRELGRFDLRYPIVADWAFNLRCFGCRDVRPQYLNRVIARFKAGGLSSRPNPSDSFLEDRKTLLRTLGPQYVWLYALKQATKRIQSPGRRA